MEAVLDRKGEVSIFEALVIAERGMRFVARESNMKLYSAADVVADNLSVESSRYKKRLRNCKHELKRPDRLPET